MLELKKGQRVVRIINVFGSETASICEVAKVSKTKGLIYLDADDLTDDGVCTYRLEDGRAVRDYIAGCSSRLIMLEE